MRFTRNTSASSLSVHTATENEFANRSCRDCCQTPSSPPSSAYNTSWLKDPRDQKGYRENPFPIDDVVPSSNINTVDCKYGVIERSPSPPSIEKNRIEKVIEQRSECVASTFVTLALERKSRIRLEQALYIVKYNLREKDSNIFEYISPEKNRELRSRIAFDGCIYRFVITWFFVLGFRRYNLEGRVSFPSLIFHRKSVSRSGVEFPR